MTFHNRHKRLFRLLAPLLALFIALSPLNGMAFSPSDADVDTAVMQGMDMSDKTNCDEMDSTPVCEHCSDPAQCSSASHLCGHASASLIQDAFNSYSLSPLSYEPSYTEYLPTAAPEAAFRPPIRL